MRRLLRFGRTILLLGVATGCEPSSLDDLRQVEGNLRAHYEMEKPGSPKLNSKERRIRAERLRMQFGDIAE